LDGLLSGLMINSILEWKLADRLVGLGGLVTGLLVGRKTARLVGKLYIGLKVIYLVGFLSV
jgi:hypothetical protein